MLKLGFSGTKKGMTLGQFETLCKKVIMETALFENIEGHHGDCIGADKEFHSILDSLFACTKIVIHPSNIKGTQAHCVSPKAEWREELPPLTRDRHIAKESDYLFFTPKEDEMMLRSGTWTTVRKAIAFNKKFTVILPDGSIRTETYYG